jgi:cAMP-specific phosphodiesterase 4
VFDEWTRRVYEEFFRQGDAEKGMGLPTSFDCDRTKTNPVASQLGFIKTFIKPLLETLSQFCPSVSVLLTQLKLTEDAYAAKL